MRLWVFETCYLCWIWGHSNLFTFRPSVRCGTWRPPIGWDQTTPGGLEVAQVVIFQPPSDNFSYSKFRWQLYFHAYRNTKNEKFKTTIATSC
jgi:hypothetical protein